MTGAPAARRDRDGEGAKQHTNGLVLSWAPRPLMRAKSAGRMNDQVRRHDVVVEVAVVRGEDVELEIPRAPMLDMPAVEHDAEVEIPRPHVQGCLADGDAQLYGDPGPRVGGQAFERQPAPGADLDGVATSPPGQQPEDLIIWKTVACRVVRTEVIANHIWANRSE